VFVNACRHRGTRLVADRSGHKLNFACPYHAWTYSCDGRLTTISHASGFPGVDKESTGLVELPSREHLGFLWAGLRPGAPFDLEEHLGPMAAELLPLDIGSHVLFDPSERLWKANWKILIEGGLEAYHFRYVHAKTIYSMFFDNLLVWDALGSHQRLILPKRSVLELEGKDPAEGNLRDHANVLLFLYPNVILMVQKDHLVVFTMSPESAGETRITIQMLLPEAPDDTRAASHWAKNREITLEALTEDFEMGEEVQAGLSARAFDDVIFGKNEPGPAAFHDSLDKEGIS
jgi:phenylpropionate dioxygenase-like ring-hydroxylating dioxygenase large terminal subunit